MSNNEKIDRLFVGMLNALLAKLCGEVDRTRELSGVLVPDDLPTSLPVQRKMLHIYLDCAQRGIPPTYENLVYGLGATFQFTDASAIDAILSEGDVQADVYSLSAWIQRIINQQKTEAVLRKGLEAVSAATGGALEDRLEKIAAEISHIRLLYDDTFLQLTDTEMWERYDVLLAERERLRKEGVPPGPSLMFRGFVGATDKWGNPDPPGLVPHLRWAQSSLVTGLAKSGKTTLGTIWAEHNAYELGIDVLYMHNETEWDIISNRLLQRHLLVPSDYLSSGQMPVSDMEHPIVQAYQDWKRHVVSPIKKGIGGKEIESGRILWAYCPMWDVFRIINTISLMRQLSVARGKGLLVIVDYYNLIDQANMDGDNKADKLGQVAFHLREGIKQENMKAQKAGAPGVHCIIFAQESSDGRDVYAYGSRQIVQYSQLHISIQRTEPKEDSPMGDKRNALGHPRYWHRQGELHSDAELVVVRGNDAQKGVCKIRFENALCRVIDG